MANEITYTASISAIKGTMDAAMSGVHASKLATLTGFRIIKNIQEIGTSEEAIGKGELATLGWFWAKNLDSTNFLELYTGTGGVAFAKLKAGEAVVLRLGSGITAPYAKADTSACRLQYVIMED